MMRLIIEFAYTGALPVTEDNVERLLEAADQFCITGIVQACCEFLESQLCLENCIGICKFADFYSCDELRSKAFLFTLHHFEDIAKVSEEFLELSLVQLCDLIEKDNLNAKQEDQVYQAILRWVSHDLSNRKHSLPVLLPKVTVSSLDSVIGHRDLKCLIHPTYSQFFYVNIFDWWEGKQATCSTYVGKMCKM